MKKVIVIVGPTGVGKTKLSIELAKKFNGEIINADAMQIYKGLDIGTAKIKLNEMENIPHYLFDIKNVNEEYSIYNYQIDCRNTINKIIKNNKTPILVGGTGLYIKSALYDYKLTKNDINKNQYKEFETDKLYQKLILLDPLAEGKINKNNRQRIINAINYYNTNKKSITLNKTSKLLYNTIFIGLTTNRNELYEIINNRVDKMINNGLIEEVKYFYDKKIYTKPLMSGIGYKELYQYFDKKQSLNDAINQIKKNSRRYAKRQYTFFNHQMPVTWFNTDYNHFDETVSQIIEFINKNNKKNVEVIKK